MLKAFPQVDSYGEAGRKGPLTRQAEGKAEGNPFEFEKDSLQSTLTYTPDAICQRLLKANILRTEQAGATSTQIKKTEHDQLPRSPLLPPSCPSPTRVTLS